MVDPVDICKICLRTEVKLKEIDKVLKDYYYVVTDFALFHIDSRLCCECEYLLRKHYNFSRKCVRAAEILQLWHRNVFEKTDRKPLSVLHTQVPQLPLKVYTQENIQTYTHNEAGENLTHEELVCELTPNNVIKKELKLNISNEKPNNLVSIKEEDTAFQEVLIQNANTENNEILVNEDDIGQNDGIDDMIDDASLSSDDEVLAIKKLRKETDYQTKVSNKTKITTKELNKGNCDSENKDDVLKSVFTTVVNSKEDNRNVAKKISEVKSEKDNICKTEKYIISKLQNMNKSLNIIYKRWEKISLTDLPAISVSKEDSTTKRSVAKRKLIEKDDLKGQKVKKRGVIWKIAGLSADLDSIRETCGKLINYKEGLLNPKERLRAELTSKFASCGELKTDDGFVLDKEVIMRCFDRVSECLMRRLWRFLHGKPDLEARAINTLKHIQIKYQNEYQYETVFDIEYLNTKEKVQEEFEKRRTYKCYLEAKYRCETCFLGFKHETQIENHRHSHEEAAGEFPCVTCGVRHRSKRALDTHSKSHEAVYKCKRCPLVTYYRYSMMNHYHQHEGLVYKCEQCDTTFRSKSAYKTHIGLRHSASDKICTTCGRSLSSERALAWHMARHARDSPTVGSPVPCATCNLIFATQQAYWRHARTSHSSPATLTKQKAKEEAPKKKPIHTCRVCNAEGNSIGWLTLHFRLEHPAVDMALTYADKRLHLCEICGKGYTNVYNLRDHLAIHADVRAHACQMCGARFHRAVSLVQHQLTHQPPRRACHACGKRFHSQSNLNNHMRGHSGDRRYKCNLCGKGFLHRNALNEHIRGVHYKMRRARKRTHATETSPHKLIN